MCDGSLAMINDGGVSVKGGHNVSKCVMCYDEQYGHGAGDMNAGHNSSCHHKKVFGLSLFLLSTFPGVAAVLVSVPGLTLVTTRSGRTLLWPGALGATVPATEHLSP